MVKRKLTEDRITDLRLDSLYKVQMCKQMQSLSIFQDCDWAMYIWLRAPKRLWTEVVSCLCQLGR